ncbi:hypothetical protein KAH55_05920, partial [bacterium]|nr:hypothetical protein [bacterium]
MRKTIENIQIVVSDGVVRLSWLKSQPWFVRETDEFERIRIYRKAVYFEFSLDYESYFLNETPEGAAVIFDGVLPCTNNRKFVYEDQSVRLGETYAYFIQTRTSDPIGPAVAKVRDPEVWWSYKQMVYEMERLAADFSGTVVLEKIGKTVMHRDIPVLSIGRGERVLAMIGLVHAGEAGPELMLPVLRRILTEQPELLQKCRVRMLPAMNIDERERMVRGVPWYLRVNAQGVDLNRNFPIKWDLTEYGYGMDSSDPTSVTYRGPAPASAPETRAVMDWLKQTPPDVVVSFHSLASICSLPALTSRFSETDDAFKSQCLDVLKPFAAGFFPEIPFEEKWLNFGTSAGSLPAWCYQEWEIPAFDLEAGAEGNYDQFRFDRTDLALLESYR